MRFIADLQIHSKYSRATSPKMVIEELSRWAKIKGIKVLGTGDFTHPAWFKELKEKLQPAEPGLFVWRGEASQLPVTSYQLPDTVTRFMLTAETSHIYSKSGKVRRVHLLIWAPSFEAVEKINAQLSLVGNLRSDGRPILGLDSKELLKIALGADPNVMVIPAHCLLPDTIVHTKSDLLKPIQDIKEGDFVVTHNNRWRKVQKIFKRSYNGRVYHVKSRNFSLGLTTTAEHPFYAIKTHKNCHWNKGICKPSHTHLENCKNKYFKDYKPEWIMAHKLERGDVLIFPRFKEIFENLKEIDLEEITKESDFVETEVRGEFIVPIGHKVTPIRQRIIIDKNFCKLAGYYLSEGYTNSRDLIGFAFGSKEKVYIEETIELMQKVFGFSKKPKMKLGKSGGIEILFYSKILCDIFQKLFYSSHKIRNAGTKSLPVWALGLPPDLQVEIFRCWYRGDNGYTTSRLLMNQMKIILLRLGIVPSIRSTKKDAYNSYSKNFIGERKIRARYDIYSLTQLSFYEDKFNLLQEPEFAKAARHNKGNKYGWTDDKYIYLPIYNINVKNYSGEVYNLEVEGDNSYICEFAAVHNCWTPWFSVFGSMSGFDSLEECFDDLTPHIHAIETGLSSDPAMNWRLSQLDKVAIISNSDSHSLERIGREANIFDTELSYQGIIDAVKASIPRSSASSPRHSVSSSRHVASSPRSSAFVMTVEFFPEEGKYHYDGHRACETRLSPEETKTLKGLCPKCAKPVTVGVLSRVEELADRPAGYAPESRVPYKNLVPLDEIIAEALGVQSKTKKVFEAYQKLCASLSGELPLLLNAEPAEIARFSDERVAEGVRRVREGKLEIAPGYDGEYGRIKIFGKGEDHTQETPAPQQGLF
jgi:PHP family Zn ribbon phosphoesterase/intein/homing endonuclease